MTSEKRRPIIAGNWKMNTTPEEGAALAESVLNQSMQLPDLDMVVCPPFTGLHAVAERLTGSSVSLGAQDMHWESDGAYTGAISAKMLLTLGCRHVILGHSERRTIFGESDDHVNRKIHQALTTGLLPIVCVGESLDERESRRTEQVVTVQIRAALSGISEGQMEGLVLAYEPIWAIGTGRVATPEQANSVHHHIRSLVEAQFGAHVSSAIRIQYGGSVKPDNAHELLSQPDIDGALIGGASLEADSFIAIAQAAVS
ncbi:MAG: triose-phosphate isomerase [Candidatus Latescibacteria bacterium]|jgi:triosephosphate isomerase (TIM)|nr:triose-phosphate isomerase [Candidatus Latescibacterota bacterium]